MFDESRLNHFTAFSTSCSPRTTREAEEIRGDEAGVYGTAKFPLVRLGPIPRDWKKYRKVWPIGTSILDFIPGRMHDGVDPSVGNVGP